MRIGSGSRDEFTGQIGLVFSGWSVRPRAATRNRSWSSDIYCGSWLVSNLFHAACSRPQGRISPNMSEFASLLATPSLTSVLKAFVFLQMTCLAFLLQPSRLSKNPLKSLQNLSGPTPGSISSPCRNAARCDIS